MKITTYTTTGTKDGEIELPLIFSTCLLYTSPSPRD